MKCRIDLSNPFHLYRQAAFFCLELGTKKLVLASLLILVQISIEGLLLVTNVYAQTPAEAMEEAKQILSDFGGSLGEVNSQIEQTEQYYNQFRECVTGQGDTGRECQQYIDLLYASVGIEAQDAVMDVKMTMEEMLYEFESSRAFQFLGQARDGFSTAASIVGNAKNVIDFADQFQKYNPEGARGDPTRGLRMIGEAIGEAAGKLPFPMNRIFEGYAESVQIISGKLVELQENIERARQGNLGGGFSSYADAQTYFENNLEQQLGLSSIEYFDVTAQFSLLVDVQIFQNLVSNSMDYYVYDQSLGRKRGWIVPPVFQTVYNYFEAVPPQYRGEISAGYRTELLVSQARSNPNRFIEQAKQDYQLLSEAEGNHYYQRILEELDLQDDLSSILAFNEDAFVGLWLFSAEVNNQIRPVLDAVKNYVYAAGTIYRNTDNGRTEASNVPVVLQVEGGGTGYATTDEQGTYFVLTRGALESRFTIEVGQGEEKIQDRGQFYQPGFDGLDYELNEVTQTSPISLAISPEQINIRVGETTSFTALAVFENDSTVNVTQVANWSNGSSSFTASEAGETTITASYMGVSGTAMVTVEETTVCNEPSEIFDEETGNCVCNTAEGFEMNEELGKCINIDEAIEEVTEDGDDAFCNEESLVASLARLDELVASGNRLAANFQATVNKFMKEVNDQNSDICENTIIAAAFAGAKDQQAEYQLLVDEATSLSTDLILEGSLCPLDDVEIDINSILQKISQLGPGMGEMERSIAMMEDQLLQQSCDTQEVEDQGDTVAERNDPELTQAGGTGASEICGDGIDNDGNGLIDDGCAGSSNFNVIISLYDSGNLADDVFGLSVSGQGYLGNTPEGGLRAYPLRLSPGSYVATITVIKAPDDQGTYTISIMEGSMELTPPRTGSSPQGDVIDIPFTVGGNTNAAVETESMLPMLINSMRRIDQTEGEY